MRIRITRVPEEPQLDGVPLDRFVPGTVREVAAPLAAWLIAQGYAECEMRRDITDELGCWDPKPGRAMTALRLPRRRATDR